MALPRGGGQIWAISTQPRAPPPQQAKTGLAGDPGLCHTSIAGSRMQTVPSDLDKNGDTWGIPGVPPPGGPEQHRFPQLRVGNALAGIETQRNASLT